jgi:hypothetical protein
MTRIVLNESYTVRGEHTTVTVTGQPLEVTLDPAALGEGPATAIRDAIAAGIRGISERASKATIARRKAAGVSGDRLFNASGHLVAALATEREGEDWNVTAPADRLDEARIPGITQRLADLVDAIRDPLAQRAVRDAIERTAGALVRKLPR